MSKVVQRFTGAAGLWLMVPVFLLLSGCSQASAPSTEAVKLLVEADGVYRVKMAELQRAGLMIEQADYDALSLTENGEPVPYLLRDNSVIFYGQASDSRYTASRPYIIRAGAPGMVMEEVMSGASHGAPLEQVTRTLHLEENYEYFSEASPLLQQEPWFWQTLPLEGAVDIDFSLAAPANGAGILKINLYGATHSQATNPDHTLSLSLNGVPLPDVTWDGQTVHTASLELPPGTLRTGSNQLLLENLPDSFVDLMRLDWIELTYDARPIADEDVIDFHDSVGRLTLEGFDEPPLILDVRAPAAPRLLTGWREQVDGIHMTVGAGMNVVAVGKDGFRQPTRIAALRDGNWRDPDRAADLIIVTTDQLLPALTPLVAAREEEGLRVAVVPVEEIYDEFGGGASTPVAIHHFVRYAHQQWARPGPRYLLLVGEATTDYRGYLSERPENPIQPPENTVPPYLVPVNFSGETISDSRLADVDGDLKPDLAVGRWPVDSVAAVEGLVERTLAYEASEASAQALFAADGTSPEFEQVTDRILRQSDFPTRQTERLTGAGADAVAASWNEGRWLVTYTGHGSLSLWGKDELFSGDTVELLSADAPPPLVLQLTCLSGLFAHPEGPSLSETLLTNETGTVLTVAATSLTLSAHQEPFAVAFLRALRDDDVVRVGDALQRAKDNLDVSHNGLREVVDTFILLGDPSAHIVRP